MQPYKIMFVDDDPHILDLFVRGLNLIRKRVEVMSANSAEEALAVIEKQGPFAVVVSDMQMPGMSGIELLARVRELHPDTVRVLLTAFGDLRSAIAAINESNIFRFLTKPCSIPDMIKTIRDGLEQYRLITAERELLQDTLRGIIQVLTDILALMNPEAHGRASRIRRNVHGMGLLLAPQEVWLVETAAMLSQLGCITLAPETINRIYQGQFLSLEESTAFKRHPSVGRELIAHIPRLEDISQIIFYQEKHFDGTGAPEDDVSGTDIPLGARILKVALDYDLLEVGGYSEKSALQVMEGQEGLYDPEVFRVFKQALAGNKESRKRSVTLEQLHERMIIDAEIKTPTGILLIARGQQVNRAMIQRLYAIESTQGLEMPIRVLELVKE